MGQSHKFGCVVFTQGSAKTCLILFYKRKTDILIVQYLHFVKNAHSGIRECSYFGYGLSCSNHGSDSVSPPEVLDCIDS